MVRIHKRIIQKCLNDSDNHDGVVIYLESDIWECELNASLGNFIMGKDLTKADEIRKRW